MLAIHLFVVLFSVLLCNASPVLRRQAHSSPSHTPTPSAPSASIFPSVSPSASAVPSLSASPEPSISGLAVPSGSLSAASPSESASAVSQSNSVQPSASAASQSLDPSLSQSLPPASSPASVPPAPVPSANTPIPEPSPPVVTPGPQQPPPSVVVDKLPPSSVTKIVTAEASESAKAEPSNSGNSSKSFWDNQSAVIATFVIVGVAALGLLGMIFFYLRKRAVRKEQESLDDGFFEKFNDAHSDRSLSITGHGTGTSDHASVSELHSAKPMTVREFTPSAPLAPHLGFSGQNFAQYQDTSNYVRTDERSLDRRSTGSGDSFYGGPSVSAHRVPRGY